MEPVRPSIVRRPRRGASEANVTTADREYQREQARLRARAEQRRQLEQDRLARMYGTPESQAQLAERTRRDMQQIEEARLARLQQERVEEAKAERLGSVAALTQQQSEEMREKQRRDYSCYVAQENRRLIEQHRLQQQEERAKDRELATKTPDVLPSWRPSLA